VLLTVPGCSQQAPLPPPPTAAIAATSCCQNVKCQLLVSTPHLIIWCRMLLGQAGPLRDHLMCAAGSFVSSSPSQVLSGRSSSSSNSSNNQMRCVTMLLGQLEVPSSSSATYFLAAAGMHYQSRVVPTSPTAASVSSMCPYHHCCQHPNDHLPPSNRTCSAGHMPPGLSRPSVQPPMPDVCCWHHGQNMAPAPARRYTQR
jgi:hypothetical protein